MKSIHLLATVLISLASTPLRAGTVGVTLKNVSGVNAPAAGTRFVLYTSPSRQISGSNPATFSSVPTGTYTLEGYYTGTFWGEEYWASQDVTVPTSGTVSPILTRHYPYVSSIVFKIHSSGATISPGQSIQSGTQLRVEVTIQNNSSVSLNCRPHVVVDRSQFTSYDLDLNWTAQSVSSGGSRLFTTTFTPTTTGQYYYAYEAWTTLLNGNTTRTDSAGWPQTFQIICPTPGIPGSPNPASGSTGVSTYLALLDWADTTGATSYDVYFGTSSSPPYRGSTTSSQWSISGLMEATTYYWKVVAINSCGSTAGSVWSFATARTTGDVSATLRNVSGVNAPAAGTRSVLYTSPLRQVNGANPATFNAVPPGTYAIEGYYTGTFWGEEFWASTQVTVTAGQMSSPILSRQYPYIAGIVIKNHATGATIAPGQNVTLGTQLRAEVTVRNDVPGAALDCAVHLAVDRSQSASFDIDLNSSTQSVSGSGGTRLYTLIFTPPSMGQYYFACELMTKLANGNTTRTDSAGWSQTANIIPNEGTLTAILQNANGNTAPATGCRMVLYTSPNRESSGVNPVMFSSVPAGTWTIEGYYTGTFFGEEFWASQQPTVTAGQATAQTLARQYPYATSVVISNLTSGGVIAAGQTIPAGTQVRAYVTVRNDVPSTSLNSAVRILFDINQAPPFNFDSGFSAQQIVAGSGGTRTYTFDFTPTAGGQYSFAVDVWTTLANSNTVRTDSWGWGQTFQIVSVDLLQATFSKTRYEKGDAVTASFVFTNKSSTALQNVSLETHFTGPTGGSSGGVTSAAFTINANGSYTLSGVLIWQIPSAALSGAYVPLVTLRDAADQAIATFAPSASSDVLPVLPVGIFPRLNALIVRSQEHFSSSDSSDVTAVIQQFRDAGISRLSLSIKLDDGAGNWPTASAYSGRVLFSSAHVTPSGTSPLPYDLYQRAQAVAQTTGVKVDIWVPTFYDKAALTDHPTWQLTVNPGQQQQDFIDASLADTRNYEANLILDSVQTPYSAPARVTIDHFRYTYGQHTPSFITTFVSTLKSGLPVGTQLAGYMWLPSDTSWSGQDYASLQPYFDVMSPMLYWQNGSVSPGQNVPEHAREWVSNSIQSIIAVIGVNTTKQKVAATVSITSSGQYSDSSSYSLDDYAWRRTQLNVLGALGDAGIQSYDLFYHGNWFWLVDGSRPSLGRWVDRATYLSSLNPGSSPIILAVRQETNLVLSWPTNAVGFTLEYATSLPASSWTAASPLPVVVGSQNFVTNPMTGGTKFYRLRKP